MYSAGILPYTIFNNNIFFLIGQEKSDKTWSDFGGHSKKKDNNYSLKTAFREFLEETNNCIPISFDYFETSPKMTIISKTMKSNPYYMYIMYIDNRYVDIHKFLNNVRKTNHLVYNEKINIMWVSFKRLKNIVSNFGEDSCIRLRSVFYKTLLCNLESLNALRVTSINEK